LHDDYAKSLEEGAEIAQPCPDVFWFPIVTDRFADDLVAEMENFGQWSTGNHEVNLIVLMFGKAIEVYSIFRCTILQDDRLSDGYEAVPTRDIHMKQVGLEEIWLDFLVNYVKPLQEIVFQGYESDVSNTNT
jgi:hypothetical protein